MKNNSANRTLVKLGGGLLLVALVCLASAPVSRAESAGSNRNEKYLVLGTIEIVDSATNTLTVRLSDGTDKILQVGKHLSVNGREETRNRGEAELAAQERAVIYYTDRGGQETAVEVESLNHAMRRSVSGTLVSADKDSKVVVLRTLSGKEETFRVQNDAVIETDHNVMIFSQYEPEPGAQITLHYADAIGMPQLSRIKR